MLEFMRSNAKGMLGKVIVFVIVVVFALWGAESIVSISTGGNAPASVNGVDIKESEVQRLTQIQLRNIQEQLGGQVDPAFLNEALVRGNVIQSLINQQLELQSAQEAGLAYSDESVTEMIVESPVFQVDGSFDEETYRRLVSQSGYTPLQYKEVIRQGMMTSHLRSGLVNTAFSLPNEVETVLNLEKQQRSFSYLTLSVEDSKAEVELTDEEIEQYYQVNRNLFKTDEQVKVDYLVLNREWVSRKVTVSEQEIQDAYQVYLNEAQNNQQRFVSHILISSDNDNAQELAGEIKSKLDQGADFSELAKEYSDDPGSKDNAGSLGVLQPGVFVPEFEQAANLLAEIGQISEPVKTDFGYHVIKLDSIKTVSVNSFTNERNRLKDQLLTAKVDDELLVLQDELSNIVYSSPKLTEAAEQYELTVESSEFFSRKGGDGIFSNQALVEAAFSDPVLNQSENSEVVTLADGSLAVVRLNEFKPADFQPLEEVRDQVVAQLTVEKARQLVQNKAADQLKQLKQGGTELSNWTEVKAADRNFTEVDQPVMTRVFKMPKPDGGQQSFAQVPQANGDITLVALSEVITETEKSEDDLENMNAYLASLNSEAEFENWFIAVREESDIDVKQ